MNIIEKIFSKAAHKIEVRTGDIVEVGPDLIMSHDGDNVYNIDKFKHSFNCKKILNPKKIIMGLDHNVPSNSISTAKIHSKMRRFAKEQNIIFYDQKGVLHQLMIENHVKPYQLIFAADSHACTYGAFGALGLPIGTTDNAYLWATGHTWYRIPKLYTVEINGSLQYGVFAKDIALKIIERVKCDGFSEKIVQFCGDVIEKLSLSEKITLCNMASEGGAISAIIDPDNEKPSKTDISFDINDLEPLVAMPHSVDNIKKVTEVCEVKIDQVFIGSCTNGRFEDYLIVENILKNRKVSKDVRLYISPASNEQLKKITDKGILKTFIDAGAIILNSGCSMCFGSCQGIMDDGEVLFTTGNRNYRARVGTNQSYIFLGSPATAAATAITGVISDPRKFISL